MNATRHAESIRAVLALAVFLVVTVTFSGSASGQSISFEASTLFLDNGGSSHDVLSQHVPFVGNPESAVLFADSVELKPAAGIELTLRCNLDDFTMSELSYFGQQRWTESAVVTDTDNLQSPFRVFTNATNFRDADQQGFDFSSEIHNVEWNIKRQVTAPIWFVAGMRYIDYDEQLNFFSVDDNEVGRYNVAVDNRALGLQAGGEANYAINDWLEISTALDAGLLINWVKQDTFFINPGTNFVQRGGKSDTSLSGLIDFNFMAAIVQGNWRLKMGYRVLLMTGMAKAADQFDFSINENPAAVLGNVNHQGSVVLHGPWIGLLGEF